MRRRRIIGWLVALAVVAVLLVVADRISASVASRTAQRYLARQAAFEQSPTVQINGFPFLTQSVEGRYDDVRVRSGAVSLDGVRATDLQANLHGVRLPLSAALGGHVHSLPIDSVDGSVTFTYAEVEQLAQIPGLTLAEQGGQLAVSATLAIPGLSAKADVSGTATVKVTDGALQLAVTGLSVAGQTVSASVISQLEATLATPITLPALPYGLHVDAVTAQPTGVQVAGSASNVVLTSS